jgi:hypothetical protein
MATVVALAIGLGYLVVTGGLDRQKLARIIAVAHGLELSADEPSGETVTATPAAQMGRQPSDVLAVRSSDLDLRERFIEGQRQTLELERTKLVAEQSRLAEAQAALKKQRSDWEDGERAKGIEEAVLLIGKLSPSQAKEQILLYLNKGEMDWVVSLMRKLPVERQAKIASEFTTPEDTQRLAEIIRRIRDAQPPLEEAKTTP